MRVALRKWLSIASKAICVRVRLIIDVTLQRHIIYVVGNTCGCINNDAKRLLNNLRREYVCWRNRFYLSCAHLILTALRTISLRRPQGIAARVGQAPQSLAAACLKYIHSCEEPGLTRLVLKEYGGRERRKERRRKVERETDRQRERERERERNAISLIIPNCHFILF